MRIARPVTGQAICKVAALIQYIFDDLHPRFSSMGGPLMLVNRCAIAFWGVLGGFAVVVSAPAATTIWTNGATTNEWTTNGNWSGGVPSSTNDAFFNNTSPAGPITVTGATTTTNHVSF